MISLPAESRITGKKNWPWLPGLSAAIMLVLSLMMINSGWIQGKIVELHKDPFTLERSFNALAAARLLIPGGVLLALAGYLPFRNRMAKDGVTLRADQFFAALLFTSTVCALLRLLQCPVAGDDSYIDFRYVLRWLGGNFDYNTGEKVMGFTSHLHLILLYLICLAARTNSVDLASYYLSCFADQITTVLLFALVWKVYKRFLPAFLASLLYAANVYSCQEVVAGKESALVALTMTGALYALVESRLKWLPWCGNILFWLRPEGAASCLVLLFTAYKKEGKQVIKSAWLPCALSVALLLFLFAYFGTIMPHGMIAKAKAHQPVQLLPTLKLPLETIGSEFTNATLSPLTGGLDGIYTVATLLAVASLLLLKAEPWKLFRGMVFAQLAFLLISRPAYFGWYFCWFSLLGPILAAVACHYLLEPATKPKAVLLKIAAAAMAVHVFLYVAIGLFWAPYNWLWTLERVRVYREAAQYLIERTGGNVPIAAADVGMIGYTYPGHITDIMGLISEESLQYYPLKTKYGVWPFIKYLMPPQAIAGLKPIYLVAAGSIVDELLLEDEQFKQNYFEIRRWENPDMVGRVVYIFQRKDTIDKPQAQLKPSTEKPRPVERATEPTYYMEKDPPLKRSRMQVGQSQGEKQ